MKRSLIVALAMCVGLSSGAKAEGFGFIQGLDYVFSLGVGAAIPLRPTEFKDNNKPGFGLNLAFGAVKGMVELGADFDFSFFYTKSTTPNDVNAMNLFLTGKIKPLKAVARPYIVVGAGYFRSWVVDLNLYENVLGFTSGAGVEMELNKKQRLFIEGRLTQGRTREIAADRANLEFIPIRIGVTWKI